MKECQIHCNLDLTGHKRVQVSSGLVDFVSSRGYIRAFPPAGDLDEEFPVFLASDGLVVPAVVWPIPT